MSPSNRHHSHNIIVIFGPTASGKSKLANALMEILQQASLSPSGSISRQNHHHHEPLIINADSQQVYKHLKIATNQDYSIPLTAFLEPQQECTVQMWRHEAMKLIETEMGKDLSERRRIIIVGGTDYYLEHLLMTEDSMTTGDDDQQHHHEEESNHSGAPGGDSFLIHCGEHFDKDTLDSLRAYAKDASQFDDEKRHNLLTQVDPSYAGRIHPSDSRKVTKALRYFLDSKGKRFSDQNNTAHLRYQNVILFRTNCDMDELDEKIEKRVDAMVEEGLIDELLQFYTHVEPQILKNWNWERNDESDSIPPRGIFQCIGYKEMRPYIVALAAKHKESNAAASGTESTDDDSSLNELKEECLSQLKSSTKRYARKQNVWFRRKWRSPKSPFFAEDAPPRLFEVNVSDMNQEKWKRIVGDVGEIVKILEREQSDGASDNSNGDIAFPKSLEKYLVQPRSDANQEWGSYHCEVCNLRLIGSFQWQQHINSRKHKKRKRRQRKNSVNYKRRFAASASASAVDNGKVDSNTSANTE